MPFDLRSLLDGQFEPGEEAKAPTTAPGKTTLTSRLAPRTLVLRIESGERGGARDRNGVIVGADVAVERAAGSTGSALPDDLRARFEDALGADLSSVRIHTGGESEAAAAAVAARAYTVGNDIHFGAGQYQPHDPFGLHLLAHEVAHTVQQQGGTPSRQHKLEVTTPGDAAEVEADRAADAMVAGQRFEVSSMAAGVARKAGGKAGGSMSTKSLKLGAEGALSFERPLGKYFTFQGTGALIGELEVEYWKDAPVVVGAGGSVTGERNPKSTAPGKVAGGGEGAGTAEIPWEGIKQWLNERLGPLAETSFAVAEFKAIAEAPKFVANELGEEELSFAAGAEVTLKNGAVFKAMLGRVTDTSSKRAGSSIAGALSGEFPLFTGGPAKLFADSDVTIKGQVRGKLEGALKPNWGAIVEVAAEKAINEGGKQLAKEGGKQLVREGGKVLVREGGKQLVGEGGKQLAKDGAKELVREGGDDLAREGGKLLSKDGIKTGLAALSTASVIELGGATVLAASVVAAFVIGASAISGNKEAIRGAEARIAGIASGAVKGLTGKGEPAGDPVAYAKSVSSYQQRFETLVSKMMANPEVAAQNVPEDEVRAFVRQKLSERPIYAEVESQVRPQIAKQTADARYLAQMDGALTMEADCRRDGEQVANALGLRHWSPPDAKRKSQEEATAAANAERLEEVRKRQAEKKELDEKVDNAKTSGDESAAAEAKKDAMKQIEPMAQETKARRIKERAAFNWCLDEWNSKKDNSFFNKPDREAIANKLGEVKASYGEWDSTVESIKSTARKVGIDPATLDYAVPNRDQWNDINATVFNGG